MFPLDELINHATNCSQRRDPGSLVSPHHYNYVYQLTYLVIWSILIVWCKRTVSELFRSVSIDWTDSPCYKLLSREGSRELSESTQCISTTYLVIWSISIEWHRRAVSALFRSVSIGWTNSPCYKLLSTEGSREFSSEYICYIIQYYIHPDFIILWCEWRVSLWRNACIASRISHSARW